MTLSIVIDVNLSPRWAPVLEAAGYNVCQWCDIGDPRASDREIMDWAEINGHVVFTRDLDFGAHLALGNKNGPSVVQLRAISVLPSRIGDIVIAAIRQHETDLVEGALVMVDERRSRVRILPFD